MAKKLKKTLGGERVGSGNKMKVTLHGYGRSSHNIGRYFKNDQAVGTIVPMFVDVATNNTDYYIDLTTKVRTQPTNGPIFGAFKHQIDVYSIPIRLYNAQLHNNALYIGLDMSKVLLPQVKYTVNQIDFNSEKAPNSQQIAQDSLTAYLGLRGLGRTKEANPKRSFPAIFELAYWDIFKNCYANKQEENAYVIESRDWYLEIGQNEAGYLNASMLNYYPGNQVEPEETDILNGEDMGIKMVEYTWSKKNNAEFEKYALNTTSKITLELSSYNDQQATIQEAEKAIQKITIGASGDPNGEMSLGDKVLFSATYAQDELGDWIVEITPKRVLSSITNIMTLTREIKEYPKLTPFPHFVYIF